MEREGPVLEPEEASDEGATMVAEIPAMGPVMEPAMQVRVQPALERPEDSGVVMPGTALGEASASGLIAVGSVAGLGAGPSGPSNEGLSQAVVL